MRHIKMSGGENNLQGSVLLLHPRILQTMRRKQGSGFCSLPWRQERSDFQSDCSQGQPYGQSNLTLCLHAQPNEKPRRVHPRTHWGFYHFFFFLFSLWTTVC